MRYRAYTESGACHEIDEENLLYRRTQVGAAGPESVFSDLRRDSEALRLKWAPNRPEVGEPWTIALEPLAVGAEVTYRSTTLIIRVEEVTNGERTENL